MGAAPSNDDPNKYIEGKPITKWVHPAPRGIWSGREWPQLEGAALRKFLKSINNNKKELHTLSVGVWDMLKGDDAGYIHELLLDNYDNECLNTIRGRLKMLRDEQYKQFVNQYNTRVERWYKTNQDYYDVVSKHYAVFEAERIEQIPKINKFLETAVCERDWLRKKIHCYWKECDMIEYHYYIFMDEKPEDYMRRHAEPLHAPAEDTITINDEKVENESDGEPRSSHDNIPPIEMNINHQELDEELKRLSEEVANLHGDSHFIRKELGQLNTEVGELCKEWNSKNEHGVYHDALPDATRKRELRDKYRYLKMIVVLSENINADDEVPVQPEIQIPLAYVRKLHRSMDILLAHFNFDVLDKELFNKAINIRREWRVKKDKDAVYARPDPIMIKKFNLEAEYMYLKKIKERSETDPVARSTVNNSDKEIFAASEVDGESGQKSLDPNKSVDDLRRRLVSSALMHA